MNLKSPITTPKILELQKKKKKEFKIKIFLSFFVVFIVLLGICFSTLWNEMQIKEIKIQGNKILENTLIKNEIENKLEEPFLFFFRKDNFLFYPKNRIVIDLQNKYKRIQNIDIKLENINTLSLNIKEREILYTWCGETLPENNLFENQKCFFVDKEGVIFDEAPYFSEGVYLKIFGKIEKENFPQIIQIYDFIKELNIPISSIFLNQEKEAELYLLSKKTPPEAPKIIFSLKNNTQEQLNKLKTSMDSENFFSLYKEKFESLIYIDLRFKNKVFHKFE